MDLPVVPDLHHSEIPKPVHGWMGTAPTNSRRGFPGGGGGRSRVVKGEGGSDRSHAPMDPPRRIWMQSSPFHFQLKAWPCGPPLLQTPSPDPSFPTLLRYRSTTRPSGSMKRISPKPSSRIPSSNWVRSPTTTHTMRSGWRCSRATLVRSATESSRRRSSRVSK